MNRTIAEATVTRLHADSHAQLRPNRTDVPAPDDSARRRSTPNGLTPSGYIRNIRTPEPDRSPPEPIHQILGLNI